MRLRILIPVLLSAAVLPAMAAPPAGADSARSFVQSFYDWYVKAGANSDVALKQKPAWFSPALTEALKADEAAAAESPDEVVGLDFDPFLNAQDICAPYKVGEVKQVDSAYEVEVLDSCPEKPGQPAVLARLVRHGDAWMFADFIYPARTGQAQDDLLSVLKALQQERDKTVK